MKKTIYIAGAVTGLPIVNVKEKFARKAAELKAQGHTVIDPVELIICERMVDAPYNEIMKVCARALTTANEVHLLPCWQQSKGACIERDLAKSLEIPIVYP